MPWKKLSFDGHGINDTDDYRSRIMTLSASYKNSGEKAERGKELGKLFEAAPQLLEALEMCVKDLAMWEGAKNPEHFPSVKLARAIIAKLEKK